jgi:hypothetical protein
MKKALAIILSIVWVTVMQAQVITTTIIAQLKDSATGEILNNATVNLVRTKDSVAIRQTISTSSGFVISRIPVGEYFLKISYVGYKDTTYRIVIGPRDTIYKAGILTMVKSRGELMEVIVKSTIPPVITKSDTIIYNAAAFKTRPNATIEDLLKKLPGIEVDQDGNITFQGERVQKIYVDGKEFFVNDPRFATRNLLADMVEKVEAFDEKSERAKLTGVPDDKQSKAINLRLKPDKKKGYFGNAQVGYASYNRSNLTVAANYFKGDAMAMLSAGSNNSGSGRINSQSKNISFNYQNILNRNWQVGISYRGNTNNSRSWMYNQRQTFFEDSSLLQEKEGTSAAESSSHNWNLRINYKIDSFSNLAMTTAYSLQNGKNNTGEIANSSVEKAGKIRPVNSALTNNSTTDNSWNGSTNLNYNRRFRKQGRYIGLSFNSNINQRSGYGGLTSLMKFYDDIGMAADSLERNNRSDQNAESFSFEMGVSYTEPLGKGQVLDFYYNISSANSERNRQTYKFNPLTGKYDEIDSIASNNFENSNGQHNFGVGYNHFRSSKFRYQVGIGMSKGWQQNKDKAGSLADIVQNTTNIFPRASLMYSISKQRSIHVAYSGSNRQPVIAELQPVPDYSNPLLIRLGNPSLKSEFNNEISAEFKDFNSKKMSSFSLNVNFRNTINRIVNSIIVNAQGIQEQQYVNMNGDYGVGGAASYDRPLINPQKPLSLRSNTSVSLYRDVNLVNKELNKRHSLSFSQQLSLNYHLDEKLFASATGSFNLTGTKYSVGTSQPNTLIAHRYSGNISYEFPGQVMLYTDFNISFNSSQSHVKGNNSMVWNATIMKRIFKSKKGEVTLSIFDILNKNNNFTQNIGDNYMETTRTEVVRQILNLSFVYRFRGNKL